MNSADYWAVCINCFEQYKKGEDFFLTNCGLILCNKCVEMRTKPECHICRDPNCGPIPICGNMPPDSKKLFTDISTDLESLTDALKFHIDIYDKILGRMDGLTKHHESEFSELKQKLEEFTSQLQELDDKIPNAQQMILKLQNDVQTLTDNQDTSGFNGGGHGLDMGGGVSMGGAIGGVSMGGASSGVTMGGASSGVTMGGASSGVTMGGASSGVSMGGASGGVAMGGEGEGMGMPNGRRVNKKLF